MPKYNKKEEQLFNAVTNEILRQRKIRDAYTKYPNDKPLIDEHPGLDLALMYAQPGNLITKALAPSMARGMAAGIANGEGAQAIIYGLIPESGEWKELTARAAELQEGNTAKYSHYMAVGKGEHLPRHIASNKKALVKKGITSDGEPYVIRQNSLAPTSTGFLKMPEGYSSPADWAMSGYGSQKVRGKAFGGSKRIKAALGTQYPLVGGVQPLNFTVPTFTPEPGRFSRFLGNFGLNTSDLAATGAQILGNIGSSLINNAAINRLRFTPIHTQTVAEAPVKFNTTYNINPQLDNLRESIGSVEREAANNSASSRTAYGRIANTRFRGIGAYNELYGQKLNQETAMLNADAQNRQGVRMRNANRLQQNIARDTIYNAQGEDNLNNTKATLKGQNWSNFVQQLSGSLIGTYNRGQQRISDANSLAYLFASNPNAARLFMNNNSLIRRIFGAAREFQGINI